MSPKEKPAVDKQAGSAASARREADIRADGLALAKAQMIDQQSQDAEARRTGIDPNSDKILPSRQEFAYRYGRLRTRLEPVPGRGLGLGR